MQNILAVSPQLRFVFSLPLLLAGLYAYLRLAEALGSFHSQYVHTQYLELALVLYIYGLLYLLQMPSWWRGVLAALPVFLCYVVNDVFFLVYGKVFRLVNLSELPELLQVLSPSYALGLLVIVILPLVLILLQLNRAASRLQLGLAMLPALLITVMVLAVPASARDGLRALANPIVKYSDNKSVENNGRLAMLLYREAERLDTLATITPYRQREAYRQEHEDLIASLQAGLTKRNIHLVVLESFLDPRLFRRLQFSRSPAHEDFERLAGRLDTFSIAPVFGGATAQAEFEVLCGVPAFEQLSSVEFNVFTGSNAYCLPDTLRQLGYRSVASNAYKPGFFNAIPGYTGAGFAEMYFPTEFYGVQKTYLKFGNPGEEQYLFDDSLFQQNLQFVKQHLEQHPGEPLFNYIMTIYGHTPHNLDPQLRPEIIQLSSDYPDDHLQRSANQFYYRSKAIADYLQQLMNIDEDAIILLIADHVPPLRNGPNTYQALEYMANRDRSIYYNPVMLFSGGKRQSFRLIHHYDIPALLLASLTDQRYCSEHYCAHQASAPGKAREDYLNAYLRLMALASE